MKTDNDTLEKGSKTQHSRNDKRKMVDGNACSATKKLKWEAKQERKQEESSKKQERSSWFEKNSSFCTRVCLHDVEQAKMGKRDKLNQLLLPYMDLKDGPKNDVKSENIFIAEGTETVRLLIQHSSNHKITIKSILVKSATLFEAPVNLLNEINLLRTASNDELPFPVLVGDEQALSMIVGYQISRGALACGIVPSGMRDETFLDTLIAKNSNLQFLALDGICDAANMGSMIRCAAAFGIDAIVLSQNCCDPWYRRSVRVSMGHVFHIPIIRVLDLVTTLTLFGERNITTYAAVIDHDAEVVLETLAKGDVPLAWCCVMGNEGNGLSKNVENACITRLRIKMAHGVDSLSVPIATGILLHGLRERSRREYKLNMGLDAQEREQQPS